jgi:hypothetical protein
MYETKRCTKCKTHKNTKDFTLDNSRSDKLNPWCKSCAKIAKKKCFSRIRGTIQYFKSCAWAGLNSRTINGMYPNYGCKRASFYFKKGIMLLFTKEEFYSWCDKHKNRILQLYKNKESPSVDRKNPTLHYSIDNIRVIPLEKNFELARQRSGMLKAVKIRAIHIETKQRITFKSIRDAVKAGFHYRTIQNCLHGRGKTHRNYRWFYA